MFMLSNAAAAAEAGDGSHQGLLALINAASSTMVFYTGVQPTNPDTAESGTLLATLSMTGAVWGESNGVLTLNTAPTTAASITGSGTVLCFRYLSGGATSLFDGTIIQGTASGTNAAWNASTYVLTPASGPGWAVNALTGITFTIAGNSYTCASNTATAATMTAAGLVATAGSGITWSCAEIGGLTTQSWGASGTFNLNTSSTLTIPAH
jgi:hypothetical protein